MKSSPPQHDVVAEAWTSNYSVLWQALYHWAILEDLQIKCLFFDLVLENQCYLFLFGNCLKKSLVLNLKNSNAMPFILVLVHLHIVHKQSNRKHKHSWTISAHSRHWCILCSFEYKRELCPTGNCCLVTSDNGKRLETGESSFNIFYRWINNGNWSNDFWHGRSCDTIK